MYVLAQQQVQCVFVFALAETRKALRKREETIPYMISLMSPDGKHVLCVIMQYNMSLFVNKVILRHYIFLYELNLAEDIVSHEFAALCLTSLAQDYSSKVTIFENDGLDALIRCLSSSDPDVQKNAIETISLLLEVSKYSARCELVATNRAAILHRLEHRVQDGHTLHSLW